MSKIDIFKKINYLEKKIRKGFFGYFKFILGLIIWVTVLFIITPLLGKIFLTIYPDVVFNDFILLITAAFVIAYTYETQKMKEEVAQQTELETRPIMCLYVRYINGIEDEEKRQSVKEKYSITHQTNGKIVPSPFYFTLRNMGKGPAFNVEIESDNFKAEKYQARFFAPEPKGDEHAVKIVKKPSDKIRDLEELKGEIFVIKCQSVLGKNYEYKYKAINITDREIEFLK